MPSSAKRVRRLRCTNQNARPLEDVQKHPAGELSGICVLQRRMEAGNQDTASRKAVFGTVRELEARFALSLSRTREVFQIAVKRDAPEADHHPQIAQQPDLLIEMGGAIRQLGALGGVVGWSTANNGANPAILQL
jgi:hypothetical protein